MAIAKSSVMILRVCRGVLNIVMKLIERKADVNAVNASGTQALHRAAIYGNAAVVKKLVEYVFISMQ